MKIRLVLSDLDGTLLSPERTISEKAVQQVRRLEQSGVQFSLITGRPLYAVERFRDRLAITAPVVACNGALIVRGTEVLAQHSAPLYHARALMEQADSLGWTVLYYTGMVEYAMHETERTRVRKELARPWPVHCPTEGDWQTLRVEKLNLMAGKGTPHPLSESLLADVEQHYAVVRYGESGMELTPLGVSKASALGELSALCKIPVSQMMAIGDAENDVEMLRAAGVGVAVGNAAPSVKAQAVYVCTQTNTEGVLEALTHFFPET